MEAKNIATSPLTGTIVTLVFIVGVPNELIKFCPVKIGVDVSGIAATFAPASTLPKLLTILRPLRLLQITSSVITLPLNISTSVFGLGSRKASGSAGLFFGCSLDVLYQNIVDKTLCRHCFLSLFNLYL